jgi:segregation and condensation protein B
METSDSTTPAELQDVMPDQPEPAVEAPAAPAESQDMTSGQPEPATPAELQDVMAGQSEAAVEATAAEPDAIRLRALLEAIVYVAEEPLTPQQLSLALETTPETIEKAIGELIAEYEKPEHGVAIREVAGGYKMTTKAEHHETIRAFVKSLKAPLKLSLAALETMAVIAYKQPITAPEIMEIRGVQGAGVLKTLLDRKLITTSGRKNVIGKPILYRTTKEFLLQFGLKDLTELPSLKEFEELRRLALTDEPGEADHAAPEPAASTAEASAGQQSEEPQAAAGDGQTESAAPPQPTDEKPPAAGDEAANGGPEPAVSPGPDKEEE